MSQRSVCFFNTKDHSKTKGMHLGSKRERERQIERERERDRVGEGEIEGVCAKERNLWNICLLYTSPSPRDGLLSRMPSSA